MKDYQTTEDSSSIRLMRLIETQLPNIMRNEHNNEKRIHLYGTGEYWTAFEKSAYMLCQPLPTCDVYIIKHVEYPFPVAMSSISNDELQSCGKHHIFSRDYPDYKELLCTNTPTENYHVWLQTQMQD